MERLVSGGDRRRRYIRLRRDALSGLGIAPASSGCGAVRVHAQLGAVADGGRAVAGPSRHPATSAGTHPAERVHPGALAAGAGLDLSGSSPRGLADLTITVCDQAHEDLDPPPSWWHWSIPDPVSDRRDEAFESALQALDGRIRSLTFRASDRAADPLYSASGAMPCREPRGIAPARPGPSPTGPILIELHPRSPVRRGAPWTHNAGRSQMAAGYLRHMAGERIDMAAALWQDRVGTRQPPPAPSAPGGSPSAT